MSNQQLPNQQPPLPPTAQKSSRGFWIAIIALLLIWSIALFFRWELRAWWWTHQLKQSSTPEERAFYLARIASINDARIAWTAASKLQNDPRPEVRAAAVVILRQHTKHMKAAFQLVNSLRDDDPLIVMDAAVAIAESPHAAKFIKAFGSNLKYTKGNIAWGAAAALGRIGGPEAEQVLIDALTGPDTSTEPDTLAEPLEPDVKAQVIDSLGFLGCKRAIPLMIEAIDDDRPISRKPQSQLSAERAIAALAGQLPNLGINPQSALQQSALQQSALQAVAITPTVSAVAQRWAQLLSDTP